MNPIATVRYVIGIIVTLIILFIAFKIWESHKDALEAADYKAKTEAIFAGTTGGIVSQNEKIDAAVAQTTEVQTRRSTKDRAYSQAIHHDQAAADWDRTIIPSSLRNADNATTGDRPADPAGGR